MQYKVPQNIDLEDKIVGPFTAKQFVYLLVGFCITYVLVITIGTGPFAMLIIVPVVALTLSLTFIRVQDRPFEQFIVAVLRYISRPKLRTWNRAGDPPTLVIKRTQKNVFKPVRRAKVTKSALEQLSATLDTAGNQPLVQEKNK